jgi:hypothetical protein
VSSHVDFGQYHSTSLWAELELAIQEYHSQGDATLRYLMTIALSEEYRNQPIPKALGDAVGKFVTEKLKSGAIVDTAGLEPTSKGVRLRLRDRKLKITDGPFTEAKEVIGGYAMVEAKSKKEAVDIATQFMELHRIHWPEIEATAEVRALEGYEPPRQVR